MEILNIIPIDKWYYKHDNNKRQYIGPYAEDIHNYFNLSDGDTITTQDNDGILYSCLKGLYKKHLNLLNRVEELENKLNKLNINI